MRNAIVYMATSPSGKRYVGVTKGRLSLRISNHFSRARKGHCGLFQNALRKYDKQIKWEILETTNNYEQALLLERLYIKKFRTNQKKFGYNTTAGGEGRLGDRKSKRERAAISKRMLGNRIAVGNRPNVRKISESQGGRPVFAYRLPSLELVGEFPAIKTCADYFDVDRRNLKRLLAGKGGHLKECVFSHSQLTIEQAIALLSKAGCPAVLVKKYNRFHGLWSDLKKFSKDAQLSYSYLRTKVWRKNGYCHYKEYEVTQT